MLDRDINIKNKQIFSYLHDKQHLPSYDTIGLDMGYQKKYFNKFGLEDNKTYLTMLHTLAFQAKYDIPNGLFFNEEIETYEDIEEYIKSYRAKKGTLVEYISPESLEEFQNYEYFYILNRNKSIVKRKIELKAQSIIIRNLSTKKINFQGYANVSCTSIILVTQNTITRNSVIFKIMLRLLVSNIIPISYLGHRTSSNEEISGYGICSKKELKDYEIINYLDVDTQDFSKIESQIINKIKTLSHADQS